jgi:hypothetical protein
MSAQTMPPKTELTKPDMTVLLERCRPIFHEFETQQEPAETLALYY